MKIAWTVTTYVRSEIPLTSKVASVMSFTFVVFQDEKPRKQIIEALVASHTRNVEIVCSEIDLTPLDNDFFSAN